MEDEVMTTAAPESDVVMTANTSPENTAGYMQEPTVDPSQSSAITADQPTPPAPKTERELAYEEINRRQEQNYSNKGSGIRDWIQASYDYDATQAGTLWVAGKINDVKTQMSFLEATLNEDLYSEMDLQKYFFDTNLATARAYAKEKKHETAYGFYRAAEEKAIAEGQLTGWYMPAEAGYMLSQWVLADENLKSGTLSDVDKARAESVRRAVSGWFAANNITERGIECLNSLYLKETIRHNQEMERLQDDANQIQRASNAAQNAANKANYDIQKATFKFQLAEMERDMGYDLNNDNVIGHTGEDAQRFGFYKDQKDWIKNNMGKAFNLWGSDHVHGILGNEYKDAYLKYENNRMYSIYKSETKEDGIINSDSSAFTPTGRKTGDNKEIIYTVVDNEIVVGYFEDGVWIPITDKDTEFSTGENINDYIKNIFGKDMNTEGINTIVIDGKQYDIGRGDQAKKKISVSNIIEHGWKKYAINNKDYGDEETRKKVEKKMAESGSPEGTLDKDGHKVYNLEYVPDKYDSKYYNEFTIMKSTDGDKVTYYSVTEDGDLKKVNEADLVDVPSAQSLEVGTNGVGLNFKESRYGKVVKSSWIVGYNKEKDITYMALPRSNGTVEYYALKGDQSDGMQDVTPKVASNNVSESEIKSAGFKVLTKPEEPKITKETTKNNLGNEEDTDIDTTITPTSTSIKTGDTTARTIPESENKKASVEKTSNKSKSDEEQVLEDYDKYVTAFAAGEVKAQVEEYDKEMLKQLGVVKV